MNLIRFAGRTLLGGFFIAAGTQAAMNPAQHVAKAKPVIDKLMPLVEKYAPEKVAENVPTGNEALVRLNGGALALGGAMFLTGIGRRLGATLIAANWIPVVATRNPLAGSTAEEREHSRKSFLTELALLGATLLATQDTQGKPDLGWRASYKKDELLRSADRALSDLRSNAEKLGAKVSDSVAEVLPN